MKILIASSEAVPYVKTGGLADVAGALCKEYRKIKQDARIILPLYKGIKESRSSLNYTGIAVKVPVGGRVTEGRVFSDKYDNYFIACDEFFDRQELYGTPKGDYADNASRFIFFARGIIETCKALDFRPDIIHCNDWQTGLVPLYLKTVYKNSTFFKRTATVFTIHNIGYQGLFPASEMPLTNLGWDLFTPDGIEFYGKINFLKAGIISADILSTVSVAYSKEILNKEFSFGLEGVLKTREDDLYGVINGIDYDEWDPSRDEILPAQYSHNDISGKMICKRELLQKLFQPSDILNAERMPLIGMVGRLSAQKGLDIVIESIPDILSSGVKIAILGKGDEMFHRSFEEFSKKYKGMISVTIGFDDPLAHRIYAGSDFFLMPSRYEPCGLGQLMALRYGCIPVARKTGGLMDTIEDFEPLRSKGTGFLFSDYSPSALKDALKRAFCVYTDNDKKNKMIIDGMKTDFSWKRSARRYIELYNTAMQSKKR
ncbi:MAG: glycogen synthase GlgA [Thermodesulfovibrionales bacterium]